MSRNNAFRSRRPFSTNTAILFAAMAGLSLTPELAHASGSVHASIYVSEKNDRLAPGEASAQWIFLPDFEAFLKDEKGAERSTAKTGLDGRLDFRNVPDGEYRLCWKTPGFEPGCAKQAVKVKEGLAAVPAVEVRASIQRSLSGKTTSGPVFGRVTLKDQSSPVFRDSAFEVDQIPQVTLRDASGRTLVSVRTDAGGSYFFPGAPASATRVEAKVAELSASAPIGPGLNDGAAVNLTFDEARPVLSEISVTPSTRRAELIAKPKDEEAGKNYSYRWAATNGRIAGAEGAKATWELTDGDQSHTARVLVRSAKGLYNIQSLSIEVEAIETGFKLKPLVVCKPPTITGLGPAKTQEFLHVYETSEAQAKAYYKALDGKMSFDPGTGKWSGGDHSNFAAWLRYAGFDKDAPNGKGITHVDSEQIAYLNFNDLGFGRRMTMRQDKNTKNVYAFVTNFGHPDQCLDNAEFAKENNESQLGPTVAMEFTPLAKSPLVDFPGKVVKFFVFATTANNKNNLADAGLLNFAILDGNGQKFVPNLCVTCHGGREFTDVNGGTREASLRFDPDIAASGAHFREFDLASFRYPASVHTDANHVPTDTAVLAAFERLNEFALATNPTRGIKELITGWYWRGKLSSPNFNAGFVPDGWSTHPDLYRNTVARSCRTCHVAINSDNPAIDWTKYSDFKKDRGQVIRNVCRPVPGFLDRRMPHAFMTYLNFWTKPSPTSTYPAKALAEFSDPSSTGPSDPPWKAFDHDPDPGSCNAALP
jgi:hypothetical protein